MVRYELDNYGEYINKKIILAVQNRPDLYDTKSAGYNDRVLKESLWREVCEQVFTTWSEFTPDKKQNLAKEVVKRWQNLRYCFKRELRYQKYDLLLSKTRRKYVYFEDLSFLKNVVKPRERKSLELLFIEPRLLDEQTLDVAEPATSVSDTVEEFDVLSDEQNTHQNDIVYIDDSNDENEYEDYKECPPPKRFKDSDTIMESQTADSTLDSSQLNKSVIEAAEAEIDDDKSFLLSLLQTFKSLPEEKKLDAKIGILSSLRRIKYSEL